MPSAVMAGPRCDRGGCTAPATVSIRVGRRIVGRCEACARPQSVQPVLFPEPPAPAVPVAPTIPDQPATIPSASAVASVVPSGPRAKAQANLAAIRLAQVLDQEGRPAPGRNDRSWPPGRPGDLCRRCSIPRMTTGRPSGRNCGD